MCIYIDTCVTCVSVCCVCCVCSLDKEHDKIVENTKTLNVVYVDSNVQHMQLV